jgi:hypothetical protein
MIKQHRIRIRGKQREQIDADLMAQLVVMLGRKLAEDARQAACAAQEAEAAAHAERAGADQDGSAVGDAA